MSAKGGYWWVLLVGEQKVRAHTILDFVLSCRKHVSNQRRADVAFGMSFAHRGRTAVRHRVQPYLARGFSRCLTRGINVDDVGFGTCLQMEHIMYLEHLAYFFSRPHVYLEPRLTGTSGHSFANDPGGLTQRIRKSFRAGNTSSPSHNQRLTKTKMTKGWKGISCRVRQRRTFVEKSYHTLSFYICTQPR